MKTKRVMRTVFFVAFSLILSFFILTCGDNG